MFYHVRDLRRIRWQVYLYINNIIVTAIVSSTIDYCSSIFLQCFFQEWHAILTRTNLLYDGSYKICLLFSFSTTSEISTVSHCGVHWVENAGLSIERTRSRNTYIIMAPFTATRCDGVRPTPRQNKILGNRL